MALSRKDAATLQEIIDLDGDCLNSNRCNKCPFRKICLPEFLNTISPTTHQRAKMALDVIAHHALVDTTEAPLQQEFLWEKK